MALGFRISSNRHGPGLRRFTGSGCGAASAADHVLGSANLAVILMKKKHVSRKTKENT